MSGRMSLCDRGDDAVVRAAPAQIPAHPLTQFVMSKRERVGGQVRSDVTGHAALELRCHSQGGTDLAGRAVAALETVMFDERLLQRVQPLFPRQPLDGDDVPSRILRREREARHNAFAVGQYRAGAAGALITALLRAVQTERLSQLVEQRNTRVSRRIDRDSVDPNRNVSTAHPSSFMLRGGIKPTYGGHGTS